MHPHYSDVYLGCINGCDSTLCEILEVNISRSMSSHSNSQFTNRNSSTSSSSNTQPANRNQNRGEIILICLFFLMTIIFNSYLIITNT